MSDNERSLAFEIAVAASVLANRLMPWLAAHDAEIRAERVAPDTGAGVLGWPTVAPERLAKMLWDTWINRLDDLWEDQPPALQETYLRYAKRVLASGVGRRVMHDATNSKEQTDDLHADN